MEAAAATMEACLVEDETEADAETVERTAEWAAEAVMRPLNSGSRRVAAQAGVARRADDGTVYLASRTVKTNQALKRELGTRRFHSRGELPAMASTPRHRTGVRTDSSGTPGPPYPQSYSRICGFNPEMGRQMGSHLLLQSQLPRVHKREDGVTRPTRGRDSSVAPSS